MRKTLTGNGISVSFELPEGSQTAGSRQIIVNVAAIEANQSNILPLRFFTYKGTRKEFTVLQTLEV